MGKIRRFVGLSSADRRLVAIAAIRLLLVTLVLRWLGFRWIAARLPLAPPRSDGLVDAARARRYAASVALAARCLPIQARCLARSIALHWWLSHEGAPSELRIGVAKRGRELDAHAWVELGGAPVNGTMAELAPFTPLAKIGAGRNEPSHVPGNPLFRRCRRLPGVGHRVPLAGARG